MSNINQEIFSKFTAIQNQIWQTVSMTVSEAANNAINFTDPLTLTAMVADLYAEMAAPKVIVQFAFADTPDSAQIILLNQETAADLLRELRGTPVSTLDDSTLSELRPAIEGLVQGLCIATGTIRNEAVVASGLTVRFQIFSFPPNMQRTNELARVNLAISCGEMKGSVMWLLDDDAIAFLTASDNQNANPAGLANGNAAPGISGDYHSDDSALDLLMDIPLEISVELGRMRMVVREVVELGAGSIVEIDKAAGEPVDVLVNGKLVARGEVVVIDDNFGVRITEILSPQERLQRLNDAA